MLTIPEQEEEFYQPSFFSLRGRIGRLRYVGYIGATFLISFLVAIVAGVLLGYLSSLKLKIEPKTLGIIANIVVWIPTFCVIIVMSSRRFNDLGQTGWQTLWNFVPVVNFFLMLFLAFSSGNSYPNKYGAQPMKTSWVFLGGAVILPISVVVGMAAFTVNAMQKYTAQVKQSQVHP